MPKDGSLISNLIYIGFGALIGFVGTYIIERIKEGKTDKKNKKLMLNYLASLTYEIKEQMDRSCMFVEGLLSERKISFSRLNYPLLDSFFTEFIRLTNDPELNKSIGMIYNRFYLINFNIDQNRYGPAVSFARGYLPEIYLNYNRIVERLIKMYDELEEPRPKDIEQISDEEIENRRKKWGPGEFEIPKKLIVPEK